MLPSEPQKKNQSQAAKDQGNGSTDEPPNKVAKLDADTTTSPGKDQAKPSSETATPASEPPLWTTIASMCIRALELTIARFPTHFKAKHVLGSYYLRSKKFKDLKKAKKILWGADNATSKTNSSALFGERKATNIFGGIWRSPLTEFDRSGSFSTHMGKAMSTLIDLATVTSDHHILLEITTQLRKAPDKNQKYLYEKQRRAFCGQSYANLKRILRKRVVDSARAKSREGQVVLLLEIHQVYAKLRKFWPKPDEQMNAIMIDQYKAISGAEKATYEEVSLYCSRALLSEKQASSMASARGSSAASGGTNPGGQTVASMLKAKQQQQNTKPTASSSSGPKGAAAGATAEMAAALQYASYYNELVKMASASAGGGSASSSTAYAAEAQAYLQAYAAAATAASYSSLLSSLPSSVTATKKSPSSATPSPPPPSSSSSSVSNAAKKQTASGSAATSAKNKAALSSKPATSSQSQPTSKSAQSKQSSTGSLSILKSNNPGKPKVPVGKSNYPSPSTTGSGSKSASIDQAAASSLANLSGVTVSKVKIAEVSSSVSSTKGKSAQPPAKQWKPTTASTGASASAGINKGGASASAAAVASATALLQQQRVGAPSASFSAAKMSMSSNQTPPQPTVSKAKAAMDRLKAFRGELPQALKKSPVTKQPQASSSHPATKQSKPIQRPQGLIQQYREQQQKQQVQKGGTAGATSSSSADKKKKPGLIEQYRQQQQQKQKQKQISVSVASPASTSSAPAPRQSPGGVINIADDDDDDVICID